MNACGLLNDLSQNFIVIAMQPSAERIQFISWSRKLFCAPPWWLGLPAEIKNVDKFLSLSETATECRVKRSGDTVKLKLRTPTMLYTIKLDVAAAEDLIKKVKCEVREV